MHQPVHVDVACSGQAEWGQFPLTDAQLSTSSRGSDEEARVDGNTSLRAAGHGSGLMLLFGAALALILAACGAAPDDAVVDTGEDPEDVSPDDTAPPPPEGLDTLVMASYIEPPTWSIVDSNATAIPHVLLYNVLETLVELDENREPSPLLAESWDVSGDELTFTFRLRDATFHNGEPLTADDVVFSLERMRESAVPANSAALAAVQEIRAEDATTVVIELARRDGDFLDKLGTRAGIIHPESAFEQLETNPVGSGPFMFDDYEQDSHVRLVRNPDYWGDAPALNEVTFRYITDSSATINALLAGDVSALPYVQVEAWDRVNALENYHTTVDPGMEILFFGINTTAPPFDDLRVRQALAHATDRQAYQDVIGGTIGVEPVCTFTRMPDPWFLPASEFCPYEYDPERAQELLAEAGHPDLEFGIKHIAEYEVFTPPKDIGVAQFGAVGARPAGEPRDLATYFQEVIGSDPGDYDLAVLSAPGPLRSFVCPRGFFTGWCNPEFDAAIEAGDLAETVEERNEHYRDALRILGEELPIIPLVTFPNVATWHPDLAGWKGFRVDAEVDLRTVHWER